MTVATQPKTQPEAIQEPIPQLECLERLIGTWEISGETLSGYVSYEWMAGGYFLIQHMELFTESQSLAGVSYIGSDPETGELHSTFFGLNESPLECEWEIYGDVLALGSDCSAVFSPGGDVADVTWLRYGEVHEARAERVR
jgi:hypothetical protein